MAGGIADNKGRGGVPRTIPAIRPEGRRLGLGLGAAALVAVLLGWGWMFVILAIAAASVFASFRDPERVVLQDTDAIIAPGDGTVLHIVEESPPEELQFDDGTGAGLSPEPVVRVSIQLAWTDVRVNRTPIEGTVRRLVYVPGLFAATEVDRAGHENERQYFLVERIDGTRVGMSQVAGPVGRRLSSFVKVGDSVGVGQRAGIAGLGSRLDIWLPGHTDANVLVGQRCVAGETVIGRKDRRMTIEGVRL